ncbi:MAG: PilZ domain-containing protein [Nitrospirota bacterium]
MKTLRQRRCFERMPANIKISFFHGGIFYSGVVTNISKKGMFVRTMVSLHEGTIFPLIVRVEDSVVNVMAAVRHRRISDHLKMGVGIEVISPSGISRD